MKITVLVRRYIELEVESRAEIEVPDNYLDDYESYDEWFDANFDPKDETLAGVPISDQLIVNEEEIDRDRPIHSGADWQFYWIRENQ